jgi:hypothetical protein
MQLIVILAIYSSNLTPIIFKNYLEKIAENLKFYNKSLKKNSQTSSEVYRA